MLQPAEHLALVRHVLLGIHHFSELRIEPVQAPFLLEGTGHGLVHLREVHHVVECVVDLRLRQGARRPIGERIGFLELHAAHLLDERSVADLLNLTEQRRRDLRIENRRRNAPEVVKHDLDVLMARMEQLHDALVLEQRTHRADIVYGKRVDDDRFVVGGHLQEAQLRVIRLLAEELGIDSQHARFACAGDERIQFLL